MRKVIFTVAVSIVLMAMLSSCERMTIKNVQELNQGWMMWNWGTDSISLVLNGVRVVFKAHEIASLGDGGGMAFYPDGTGVRTQGKTFFQYEPQVDTIRFNWQMVPTESNKFRMWGPGQFDPNQPYNQVLMSVDETHQHLTLTVVGNQNFLTYYLTQRPQ